MSDDPGARGAVVQKTVINGELPALVVVHAESGNWLVGDGINDPNAEGACGYYHLGHVLALDDSLREVMDIPAGYGAERDSVDGPWTIEPYEYGEPS